MRTALFLSTLAVAALPSFSAPGVAPLADTVAPPRALADEETRISNVGDLIDAKHWRTQEEKERLQASGKSPELFDTEAFCQLVAEFLVSEGHEGFSVRAVSEGMLLAKGSTASHLATERFLEAQREAPQVVTVSLLLFEVPIGYLGELGLGESTAYLQNSSEFDRVEQLFRSSKRVERVVDTKLAITPRMMGSASVTEEISYIKDYVLEVVEPRGVELLDPIVAYLEFGADVDVRPVPLPGDVVQFGLDVTYSALKKPMQTVTRQFGNGEKKEVGVPEVNSVHLKSILTLKPGSGAMISAAAPDMGKDYVLLVFHAPPEAAESAHMTHIFSDMRKGQYKDRWFPALSWSDIPALLQHAKRTNVLTSFPTNPVSKLAMDSCLEGIAALWLLEGLREKRHLPSRNPLLVEAGSELDSTTEAQQLLLSKARVAYEFWWVKVGKGEPAQAPLEGTGLSWY